MSEPQADLTIILTNLQDQLDDLTAAQQRAIEQLQHQHRRSAHAVVRDGKRA